MKHARFLVLLLAAAVLTSCNAASSDETAKETSEVTTVTEETTEETTGETTEQTTEETATEPEETEVSETTATETEPERVVFEFDGNPIPLDDLEDIIEEIDFGNPDCIRLPQIKIDSDEIDALNQKIEDSMSSLIGEDDPMCGDYFGGYAIFSSTPGVYSIVLNCSYCGWDGYYSAYTFDRTGHVYSTSEVLSLALISEDDFYETVKDATINHVNGWYTFDGVPIVVDGKPNIENAVIGSEDSDMYDLLSENLSESFINLDMPMFVDNDGDLCVCQAILPVADYHDCERFYRVPDGYTIEIDYSYWND
ncbi:MAG: hypothetical protein J6U23_00790 [Clostridiales bacterium]|nr:hypothetical protein [Clostridiales bacterium]